MAARRPIARRRALALVAGLGLGMRSPAQADFAYLSPTDMAALSDLVVIGAFVGRDAVMIGPTPWIVGVIRIERVVQGESTGGVALLLLPPPRPGGMVASTDLRIESGQRGLWYLQRTADGFYRMDRPDRFVAPGAANWPATVKPPN